ncbi:MAG: hypothetical protein JWQ71_4150 [Pedosphaera sp.]|nr:hypothetical protein [Pedosphaera sp.]
MNYYVLKSVQPVQREGRGAGYPFIIPGAHCSVCGHTWGSYVPIPQLCPIEFRTRLKQERGNPLELNVHRDLILDITSSLGISFAEVRPGDCLMPSLSPMPVQKDDFVWTWLPTAIFVSDRAKRGFETQAFRGPSFFKPFHYTSDEEQAQLEAKLWSAQNVESTSPFWEMTCPYIFNFPDLKSEHFVCGNCRRGDLKVIPTDLLASLVAQFDIIRVKGLNELVVSSRVKDFIEKEGFTNASCVRSFP